MDRKQKIIIVAAVLIFACLILFVITKIELSLFSGFSVLSPVEKTGLQAISSWKKIGQNPAFKRQNQTLLMANLYLANSKLEQENKALQDQFQTTTILPLHLLPAEIIGSPNFIPNLTLPESFILDKGSQDGVIINQAVIYQANLIGKIAKVNSHFSIVKLLGDKSFSFAAKDLATGSLGVVNGLGNGEVAFNNVLLSASLQQNDLVVTNADFNPDATGYPPDLVVGKIAAINKNPSALFQEANLNSLLDFNQLSTVFIVTKP